VTGVATGHDRGSVTAETAVLLPALVLVAGLGFWGTDVAAVWLRCTQAAAAAAALADRGAAPARVRAAAAGIAPADSQVVLSDNDGQLRVVVTSRVRPLGGVLRMLPPVTVTATGSAPPSE
jgi:Flp pilus assembly protein TadG